MKRFQLCANRLLLCVIVGFPGWAWAQNAVSVGSGMARNGEVADVPLTISTDQAAQGFIMAFEWDGSRATGMELVVADGDGEALNGAELVVTRVEAAFMVFSVVVDIDGQGGESIAAGQDIAVGTARIRCDGPATGTEETAINLVDGSHATVQGGPPLTNTLVQAGLSITAAEGLNLANGSVVCEGEDVMMPDMPPSPVVFSCGGSLMDGVPREQTATRGSTQTINFYYQSPQALQGLSMAIRHTCQLELVGDELNLAGGVLESTEAEFVNVEVDNTRDDGDICEILVGVLVDAVAPFDGRTLPTGARRLFSGDFLVNGGTCDECLFVGYIREGDVEGGRPVRNLVSIDFQSVEADTRNCQLCLVSREEFQRGDCNFSGGGFHGVDIADAAAQVGFIFLEGDARFEAPCPDACDANDDGQLNAADIVFLLNFLFVPGSPEPPAPGPERRGVDPTEDSLECEGGARCD